ncbi:OmpA family protein [uncultured Parabacteroides sp.]|uniref:OmpA family protein n=1 Tax=uncultured Parabacteroides sp. TaxID=512312 RepID=UPI002613D8C4|nr:OmpA family protein [uncultured Parabacteroides sp.]
MLMSCSLLPHGMMAQQETANKWYWGIAGGFHSSHMTFSEIDKEYFPTNNNLNSGVFSLFVQGEFGKQNQFGIRPQISILNRGGKLSEIYNDSYGGVIDDISYILKAKSFDLRVPLIYNFGKAASTIRPYVFVAPVLGIVTGGDIKLQQDYKDHSYEGYKLGVSDANMSSTYFAGQIGAGLKFAIPVAGNHCYLGLEANYELGFTDTYGKKEKNGEANDVANLFTRNYQINGTRKLSGFELQAVLSIPFDIFKAKKKTSRYVPPVVVKEFVETKPAEIPVAEEKPCYTLEEIITLMARNESVEGKTICAVDAIHFDFSKSTIKSESYEYLDKLATTLIRMNKRIEVKGHTDSVGSDDFNMNLSKERAEAVVEYLVQKGISRDKLTYSYYGKSKPLTTNSTDEGRAMNRRVEFTILN